MHAGIGGLALAILLVLLAAIRDDEPFVAALSPLDRPTEAVWPAINRWSERMEDEYAAFVRALGDAVAARRCRRLDECLRDPTANITFEPATDATLRLDLDCADLPYVLRAYFAFKRRLPFGFVTEAQGAGPDIRYANDITPAAWRSWRDYRTPRRLLYGMTATVHSGMYRIAPGIETGDFYPVRITRRAIQPGAIFYDPNGHVLVVADVREDGAIQLIDGHPDGSLTSKRFGAAFAVGSARLGGGFKRFRPIEIDDGQLARAGNASLADFDGVVQYDRAAHVVAGTPATYHAWVRAELASAGITPDPVRDFREQVRALCSDVVDRVAAVELAMAAGIAALPHPAALPENIYGTEGEWEIYSTPSRDARMKAAFRELAEGVQALPDLAARAPMLRAVWQEETASPACRFAYRNSRGASVSFTLDDVLSRLFDLSFDPYHCPELRWGAPADSAELASCQDDPVKRSWYLAERRLRNRIDRDYGVPTPLDAGPEAPPDLDVRPLVGLPPRMP